MAPKLLCLDGRNRQDRVIARRRLGRLRDTLVTQRTLTRLSQGRRPFLIIGASLPMAETSIK